MPNTGQPIETAASHARASRPMPWRPNGCRPRGLWTSIKQVGHAGSGPGRPLGDTKESGRRVTCEAPLAHLEGGSGRSKTSPTAILQGTHSLEGEFPEVQLRLYGVLRSHIQDLT